MARVRKKKQTPRKAAEPTQRAQQQVMAPPAASSSSSSSKQAENAKTEQDDESRAAPGSSSSSKEEGPITRSRAGGASATASKQSTREPTKVAPPRSRQQATSSRSTRSGTKASSSAASDPRVSATITFSNRHHPPAPRQVAEREDEAEDEEDSEDSDASTSSEEEEDRSNFGFPLFGPNSAISTCLRKIKELDELSRKNKAASARNKERDASTSGSKAPPVQGQPRKNQVGGEGSTSGQTAQRGRHIKTEQGDESMPSSSKRKMAVSGESGSGKGIKEEGQQHVRIKKEDNDDEDMHSDVDQDGEQFSSDDDNSDASTFSDDSRTGTPDPAGAKAEMLRNMMRDAMGMNHDLVDRIRLDTIQRLREQLASTRDLASSYNVTLAQASEDKNWVTTAVRYMHTMLVKYQEERRDKGRLTYHQAHVAKMARVGLMELERAVEKDRRWEERRRRMGARTA